MSEFWQIVFIEPLFNLLVAVYSVLPVKDLGLAVVGVVVVIRTFLFPLSKRASRTQAAMQKLQPEVELIRKKYRGNREKETRAILQLYRDHEVNPFSGILILFLQLPILIALYSVVLRVVTYPDGSALLWAFMPNPGALNPMFLGIVNLAAPSMPFAIIAAFVQYFQTKRITPSLPSGEHKMHSFQTMLAKQMLYVGPVLTLMILATLPAVVGVYWSATSLWSLLEYQITLRPRRAPAVSCAEPSAEIKHGE